jgi:hypothetical protein
MQPIAEVIDRDKHVLMDKVRAMITREEKEEKKKAEERLKEEENDRNDEGANEESEMKNEQKSSEKHEQCDDADTNHHVMMKATKPELPTDVKPRVGVHTRAHRASAAVCAHAGRPTCAMVSAKSESPIGVKHAVDTASHIYEHASEAASDVQSAFHSGVCTFIFSTRVMFVFQMILSFLSSIRMRKK